MEEFDIGTCEELKHLLNGQHIIDDIAIDSRNIKGKHSLFVALQEGHRFVKHAATKGAKYALVKEDYPDENFDSLRLIRVANPLTTFQDIVSQYRKTMPTLFVAITGSYGKTMVKDLLLNILNKKFCVTASPDSFNSQIGVPLSVLMVEKQHQIAIIEAAVSKPGEMSTLEKIIAPHFGVLTHIGKKHLSTMGDIQKSVQEFCKLFSNIKNPSWILLPTDPYLRAISSNFSADVSYWPDKSNLLPHASYEGESIDSKYVIHFPDGSSYSNTIHNGHHYFVDLLNITIKAAWNLGATSKEIIDTFASYIPEPMYKEIWQSPFGTTFVNDSPCSDPLSVESSLRDLHNIAGHGRKVLVFGGLRGSSKGTSQDYKRVGQALSNWPVDRLFLVGDHPYQPLIHEIQKSLPSTHVGLCDNHDAALEALRTDAQHDDVILFKGTQRLPFKSLANFFADTSCANICYVNLAAIEWNIKAIRKHLPPQTRLMVMVKAQAYGSDSVRIARFLKQCGIDILGVSYVDEGVGLRRSGITQDIFVINAPPHDAYKIVKWNLQVGVGSHAQIDALKEAAKNSSQKIKVHLHLDTGMSRLGCHEEIALDLAKSIHNSQELELEGIMTHFSCAEDPAHDAFTLEQAAKLDRIIGSIESLGIPLKWKHAANSSAAIRFNFNNYNMVRIGLAAWGLHSSQHVQSQLDLRLALSLVSHIEGINICRIGDSVSYGRTYKVERDQQIVGVLPIGYFDGLHRNYSGKGFVKIRGRLAPMIGAICMDYLMVDLTDIPNARIGDPVLIFGQDQFGHFLQPESLAQAGNSIAHELITCLGPRIPRVYIYDEAL